MTGLIVVGISHKTAPVELRERVALDADGREALSRRLVSSADVSEAVVLSTCNRTEVYAAVEEATLDAAAAAIIGQLAPRNGSPVALESSFRVLDGASAVRHACEVASGVDSLVLGETQILGQVRGAFDEAVAHGTAGPLLRRMFSATLQVAKRAHTDTAISAGAASIGSIAVELATKIFDDLHRRTALLLGAGETGATIAQALVDRRVGRLLIAGRGEERASALAGRLDGAVAIPLDGALERMGEVDIVLTAAAPADGRYVLSADDLHAANKARQGRDLLCIDVGVPRNVDPAAADVPDLFLYDVDDLEGVAEQTRRRRRGELPRVRALIDRAVDGYLGWLTTTTDVGPLIRALHGRFHEVSRQELDKTLSRLPREHHDAVARFAKSVVDKLLQRPTLRLKERPDDLAELDRTLRRLFDLDRNDDAEDGR